MIRGPDAPPEWDRETQHAMRLPLRRPRWSTTDKAIFDSLMRPAGDARALPIGPRQGGTEQEALAYRADTTCVIAALGGLRRTSGEWALWLVETYGCRCVNRHTRWERPCSSYRELARESTRAGRGWAGRERDVREAHVTARSAVHARLVSLGLVEP